MTTQGNNNLIHQLYYSRFNPSTFQKIGSPKESDGLHFQNLILTTDSCPLKDSLQENPNITERKILYINKSECQLPKTANVIQTIRHPDGIPAYIVAEN
jgi:hypothetical protein